MTPESLRALVREATPGPWNEAGCRIRDPEVRFVAETVNDEDARLIALAPQLATLLADAMEALALPPCNQIECTRTDHMHGAARVLLARFQEMS